VGIEPVKLGPGTAAIRQAVSKGGEILFFTVDKRVGPGHALSILIGFMSGAR